MLYHAGSLELQPDEVLIHLSEGTFSFSENAPYPFGGRTVPATFTLTSILLAVEAVIPHLFRNDDHIVAEKMLETIKIWNGKPQVHVENRRLKVYFDSDCLNLQFPTSMEAVRFHNRLVDYVNRSVLLARGNQQIGTAVKNVLEGLNSTLHLRQDRKNYVNGRTFWEQRHPEYYQRSENLRLLRSLKADGVLSEAEYERKRTELLNQR